MKQNNKEQCGFKVIGVTGGVGSGKSLVMQILKEDFKGAVILSDLVAHELMEPGAANYQAILETFGEDILDEDGKIDRGKLGSLVFDNADLLSRLNQITHPNVICEIRNRIEEYRQSGEFPFVAMESALLVGSGLEEEMDSLWYVQVADEVRIQRLMDNRGYTREYAESIIARQKPDEYYEDHCDVVIDNSGSVEGTREQILRELDRVLQDTNTGLSS